MCVPLCENVSTDKSVHKQARTHITLTCIQPHTFKHAVLEQHSNSARPPSTCLMQPAGIGSVGNWVERRGVGGKTPPKTPPLNQAQSESFGSPGQEQRRGAQHTQEPVLVGSGPDAWQYYLPASSTAGGGTYAMPRLDFTLGECGKEMCVVIVNVLYARQCYLLASCAARATIAVTHL